MGRKKAQPRAGKITVAPNGNVVIGAPTAVAIVTQPKDAD